MLAEMVGDDTAVDEEDEGEEENPEESQLADALHAKIAARFPNGASQDEVRLLFLGHMPCAAALWDCRYEAS